MKKKPLLFLTGLTVFLMSFLSIKETIGQTKYTGYQYLVNSDRYTEIMYSRKYKERVDTFTTIYKIHHPRTNKHAITIKAIHYKPQKKVKVTVDQAGGGIFSEINSEETTYETPSTEPFGFRGGVGGLGGERVPNQLKVKFISNKFENVNVLHVLGKHTENYEFFVFER